MSGVGVLGRVDEFFDSVPLGAATPEQVGPFTLFRSAGTEPFYARPRAGIAVTPSDIEHLAYRCSELALPVAIEWVVETCPTVGAAASEAGCEVTERPLLVLPPGVPIADPELPLGCAVECVPADPSRVLQARAVASVAFRAPGTRVAPASVSARRAAERAFAQARLVELVASIDSGRTVLFAGRDVNGEVVASGQYVRRGDVAEIVAVATLPAYRRQGHAGALTAALASHARRDGVDLVVLSAQDDAVARVYERIGFGRIGRVGSAGPSPV